MQPLSSEQIAPLVRRVFAEAQIVSAQRFPGLHANLNYDLKLAGPTTEVVLKVYLDTSDQRPWKEDYLLRLLTSETGVPVPRVLHFDDSAELIPHPWMLCTRLPGRPLADVLGTLDIWELESIGYEMGRYLGHIHQVPLDVFGEFLTSDVPPPANEKDYVSEQIHEWTSLCAARDLIPAEILKAVRQSFEQAHVLDRSQACLIHGDYVAQNVIVERGATGYHVTGILHLGHAAGGSPEQDMSKLFNWDSYGRPTFQKGFLDGYTEVGELSAFFWERIRLYQIFAYLQRMALILAQHKPEAALEETVKQFLAFHSQV